MPDRDDYLSDFVPLFPDEDEETIITRMIDWANEGLDPDDDDWVDTREGSFWRMAVTPGTREFARLYDLAGTDVPMSAMALWSWGEYLDDHAQVIGTERLDAVAAEGEVTFTGPEGTVIAPGTEVGVAPADPEAEVPTFQTTEGGAIPAAVAPAVLGVLTLPVRAVQRGPIGNVNTGAITELVTPVATDPPTTVTNAAVTTGGQDVQDDEALLEKILEAYGGQGGGNVYDYRRWARDHEGVGDVTVLPLAYGPGTVGVVVYTADGQPVAASVVEALQVKLDPPSASTTLTAEETLPTATIDVASTAGFRETGFLRIGEQIVQYTGKTDVTFTGATGGAGTFPVGTPVIQGGRGGGLAPVGHHVIVKTAAVVLLTIGATIEFEEGYSLDGTGGTIALRASIENSIRAYVRTVGPGGEIVRQQIAGRIVSVPGVHDVSLPTINGGGNLAIGDDPPQVPVVDAFVLVAGGV